MRRSSSAPIAVVLGWLVVVACSQSPDRPPELGKCEFEDASCPATLSGGGTQGGEEAGASPAACSADPADSQCTQCAKTTCCQSFSACNQNTDCQNLVNCEETCVGAGSCAVCQNQSTSSAVAQLATLTACLQTKCPVCSQLGVGDPCNASGPACNPGLVCNGQWCTKACVRSSDCGGLGAGGGNQLGLPNACITTSTAGEECQPGCNQDADCSAFPGSFCFATTSSDGLAVRVCVPPPDAGAD